MDPVADGREYRINVSKPATGFPYRVALAGGWIDQPWVSKICPGAMVVVSIHPTVDFQGRAGMATSSRKVALELWGGRIPEGDPIRMAQLLFGAENPPGAAYVSGSQDHIGLLVPGISRLYYAGKYWPDEIESTRDPETCRWLERVLQLVPLKPRPPEYNPLEKKNLDPRWIRRLGESGELCFRSILNHDVAALGESLTRGLQAWSHILPRTVPDSTLRELERYKNHPGGTFSGAGGGYLLLASSRSIKGAFRIKIRR
jgi:hypothetical protein